MLLTVVFWFLVVTIATSQQLHAQALSASSGCMHLYQSCVEMEQPHTVNNVYKRAEYTGYIARSMAAWLSGAGHTCLRNIPDGINNLQLSMIYIKWVRDILLTLAVSAMRA